MLGYFGKMRARGIDFCRTEIKSRSMKSRGTRGLSRVPSSTMSILLSLVDVHNLSARLGPTVFQARIVCNSRLILNYNFDYTMPIKMLLLVFSETKINLKKSGILVQLHYFVNLPLLF